LSRHKAGQKGRTKNEEKERIGEPMPVDVIIVAN
jgi:hypothetical protein